jgi:phosphopantetheine--protein transferase-like protein
MAVCAAELYPVGIDCEKCGRISFKAARRIFTRNEKNVIENSDNASEDFMRIWTAKEAYGKAVGRGLHDELAEIELYNQSRAGDIFLKNFEIVSDNSKFFICEAIDGEKVSDDHPVYIDIT